MDFFLFPKYCCNISKGRKLYCCVKENKTEFCFQKGNFPIPQYSGPAQTLKNSFVSFSVHLQWRPLLRAWQDDSWDAGICQPQPVLCLSQILPLVPYPLTAEQRTLFCLCFYSPGCSWSSVAKLPTPPSSLLPPLLAPIPWEKKNSLESCGNSLAGVMLRETVFFSWRASVSQKLCASPQGAGQRGGIGSQGPLWWEDAAFAWGSGRASGKSCAGCPALTLALDCSR